MILCSTTSMEADLGCKQVLEMLCGAAYYPVIITCTSSLSPSSVLTEELNRIKSEGFKPVILRMTNGSTLDVCSELEHEKHGIIFPKELLPIITHQVAPAQQLLDFEAPRTCQCSISGLIPDLSEWEITSNGSIVVSLPSRVQWTVIEGQNLLKGFGCCSTKHSEICPESRVVINDLQATVPANSDKVEPDNTSDINQGFNIKYKLPPSSPEYHETTKNGPEQVVDKQADTSSEATFQDEANLDLVQRPGSDGASDDPLENNLLGVSMGVNSLKHRFWSSLSLIISWLGEILCFLGQKVGVRTGVLIFTIIGLGVPGISQTSKNGPIASVDHKSMNTQHFSLGTIGMTNGPWLDMCSKSELEKDGLMLPKNLSSSTRQQVAPAELFSWQDRKLDDKDLGTCPRAISGIQWIDFEGQDLCATNSEGSNISLPKPSETCQESQSVIGAPLSTTHTGQLNNTCEIKQGDYHLKAKVPSSSHQIIKADKSEQFVDKQVGNFSQAISQGEVNGSLIRRSNNGLCNWNSNIKNYVSNAALGDQLGENHQQGVVNYVYSLKYNFWSLLSLLLLLADVMFGFMGRRPGIGIGVAVSIVLGVAIPMFVLTSKNGLPPTPFEYDFATLLYDIAQSLMFLSLMLQQTQREWLSHLMAGAAYACVTFGILGYNFSRVPLEYACAGVSTLIVFVLFAIYRNTPDRTD